MNVGHATIGIAATISERIGTFAAKVERFLANAETTGKNLLEKAKAAYKQEKNKAAAVN